MPQFSFGVLIGRFQPYHNGHHQLVKLGLETAQELIIVLGSAFQSRTTKNPFTASEREAMIRDCFPSSVQERLRFVPIQDFYDLDKWLSELQSKIQNIVKGASLCLLGFHKNSNTSQYLNGLRWEIITPEDTSKLDATDIRNQLLNNASPPMNIIAESVPTPIIKHLKEFTLSENFKKLQSEQAFVNQYQLQTQKPLSYFLSQFSKMLKNDNFIDHRVGQVLMENAQSICQNIPQYPVQFLTADAVITQNGKVLLGIRKSVPGKGLWALPGGHVEPNESMLSASIREAEEETGIDQEVKKTYGKPLDSFFKGQKLFDHPQRSLKGRIVTLATYFQLPQANENIKVSGADDLETAFWLPISDIRNHREKFLDDHFIIINHFLGQSKSN